MTRPLKICYPLIFDRKTRFDGSESIVREEILMQDRSVTEGPRTTGAIFLVIVLAWFVMPILSADAETPLWKLGIPTFSGKNPEQKAQEGPSFSFPAPNSDLPAQPNGAAAVALPGPPATVAQAESVADHLDFNPTVAAVDFQLPIPDLPEGTALQFPLAPASGRHNGCWAASTGGVPEATAT